jgi:hypothetical protein
MSYTSLIVAFTFLILEKEEIVLKRFCLFMSCGRIEIGIETSCGVVFSGQFNLKYS